MTDMATILASDPATVGEKSGARRSKSSSITTFAQSMVGAVPYHPYNTSPHPDDEEKGFGVAGGSGFARNASQKHRRHSSLPMSSRGSEGYAMSSIIHHPFSGAATRSREGDDAEPEVMAWTGPTHKRASTALTGGAMEPRSSSAGDHMQSSAGDHMPSTAEEHRSSEGGASAETGGLSPDQGAALTRKKSGAASHKTGSTKASVTRKKAPELPLPTDPALEQPTGPAPPPSAYFTSGAGPSPSTTTVNTGASAVVCPDYPDTRVGEPRVELSGLVELRIIGQDPLSILSIFLTPALCKLVIRGMSFSPFLESLPQYQHLKELQWDDNGPRDYFNKLAPLCPNITSFANYIVGFDERELIKDKDIFLASPPRPLRKGSAITVNRRREKCLWPNLEEILLSSATCTEIAELIDALPSVQRVRVLHDPTTRGTRKNQKKERDLMKELRERVNIALRLEPWSDSRSSSDRD
ncbi:hypothetical protein FS837_004622 [Tulasnella sp. UAMH 9824]|nr:hypothetical protein FS837_004622 [Tulasnella sp. UAMH 9824]